MTGRRGGFTLIELLITTAVVSILSALAVGMILAVQRTTSETRFRAEADQEIKMLADWLAASVRGVGGGVVLPWMAVYVENDVDNGGADRLTWADLDPDFGPCSVLSQDDDLTWTMDAASADGTCCVDATVAGRQVLMVSVEGVAWRSLRIARVDPDTCRVAFEDTGRKVIGSTVPASGLLAVNDQVPVRSSVDASFLGGTLHVVDVQRLSLDPAKTELLLEEDRNPMDGSFESRLMMDRIYDLQIALGYDCNPRDGLVSNDGTIADEWLGNAENDTFGRSGLEDGAIEDLRMIQMGFTHGSPTDLSHSNPVQLMDGPIHYQSGVVLQAHATRITLRNRMTFQ